MRRTLRLFIYAAVMLIVAVGVAAVLKDDPGYEAGRSEISGKLVGLTEYQENRSSEASEVRAAGDESSAASVGRVLDAVDDGAADRKAASASAPFDTRPGSVASDDAGKTEVNKADASEKKQRVASAPSSLKDREPVAEAESGKKNASASSKKSSAGDAAPKQAEETPVVKAAPEQASAASQSSAENASEDKKPQYERVVTSARFSMQGSQIKLVLQGNAPMVGHYFTLAEPDRVVLDLAGNWDVAVPRVPSNRLIEAVRVGQHDDKTRIVFDMKTQGKVALVPLNRNSLELRIQ